MATTTTIRLSEERIEYEGQLPVLIFTQQGWEIERKNMVEEIVRGFDDMLASSPGPYAMEYLKDRNRSMILAVLDRAQASGDAKYLPLIDAWERIDYQKVSQRIRQVKLHLAGPPASPGQHKSIAGPAVP